MVLDYQEQAYESDARALGRADHDELRRLADPERVMDQKPDSLARHVRYWRVLALVGTDGLTDRDYERALVRAGYDRRPPRQESGPGASCEVVRGRVQLTELGRLRLLTAYEQGGAGGYDLITRF